MSNSKISFFFHLFQTQIETAQEQCVIDDARRTHLRPSSVTEQDLAGRSLEEYIEAVIHRERSLQVVPYRFNVRGLCVLSVCLCPCVLGGESFVCSWLEQVVQWPRTARTRL